MTDERTDEYTVDVWIVQQESVIVEANNPEDAEAEAREIIDAEYWPEEIQEVRVLE